MSIVGGLDLHRKQVTFDVLDTATGQVARGRICPSNRETFRGWLERFAGRQVDLAVEGCTGWRFVVEECRAAGVRAHLAEPAEVAGLRGRRRHPKTDRLDAQHLRELLETGTLPHSWIPPTLVLETRAKVRLYKDLLDERGGWLQRVQAVFYHHGVPAQHDLLHGDRDRLARLHGLSPSGRQAVTVALRVIDALDGELALLRAELTEFARGQAGCRALQHESRARVRPAAVGGDLGRARRHPAVPHLPQRRAAHRPGHHRLLLRRQALPRPPGPAPSQIRPGAAALGAV